MSRRAARIASAIFINVLAGIPLVMLAHAEPVTPDNCLAAPKGETPAGSHWRYRVDHASKRNCWYLRREDGSVAQAVPQPSPPVPAPQPAAKPSLADARAEFRSQAAAREDNPAPPPPATAANPVGAAAGNTSSANGSVSNPTAAVATRWPEMPPAVSGPKTVVAAADPASNSAQPEAVEPTESSSAASVSELPIHREMIPTLIAATIGALGVAAFAALISRRYRRRVGRKAAPVRGAIWETTDDDRIVLSDYPPMDDRDYRPRFARGVPTMASRRRAGEAIQRAPRRAAR